MKLNPFGTKKAKRGPRKSASERLAERKRRFEVKLHREFERAVKAEPELLRNLALHTYGTGLFNEEPDGDAGGYGAKGDLLERLAELKQVKEVMDSFGGEKEESLSHMFLKTILQNFPELSSYAKQAMAGIQTQAQGQTQEPQVTITRNEPPALADPEVAKRQQQAQQEQAITDMVNRLFALSPQAAATELWNHRGDTNDVRSICVDYCLSQEFDTLCGLVEMVVQQPSYRFLRMQAQELTGSRRIWFETVYNEIHSLSEDEVGMAEESQPYPDVELVEGAEESPATLEV